MKQGDLVSDKNQRLGLGIFCIIISALCGTLSAICIRMSGTVPTFEKTIIRNFSIIALALVSVLVKKTSFKIPSSCIWVLIIRCVIGFLAITTSLYCVENLKLSDSAAILKLTPFCVAISGFFILKEKISLKSWICYAIAFLGSMLIVKPTLSNTMLLPSLSGVLSSMCAGVSITMVGILGRRKVNSFLVIFYLSVFVSLVSLPMAIINWIPLTGSQVIYLLLSGLISGIYHICISIGYKFANGGKIAIYDYTQLIFNGIAGFIIFSELPDVLSIIGSLVVIIIAVYLFYNGSSHHFIRAHHHHHNRHNKSEKENR